MNILKGIVAVNHGRICWCLSLQKKAVVIRHLYSEEKVGIPEGTVTSTEVSGGCEESSEQSSDIRIPEEPAPAVKAELQVRTGRLFNTLMCVSAYFSL